MWLSNCSQSASFARSARDATPPAWSGAGASAEKDSPIANLLAKLILISKNCPPLRKSELEYYAML